MNRYFEKYWSEFRLWKVFIVLITVLCLVPATQSRSQGSTYYGFAYFYGKEETLLITGIESFEVLEDLDITPKAQIYFWTRDNNQKFKYQIRNRYPDKIIGLTKTVETIILDTDLGSLKEERQFMINRNEDNLILIHDFEFNSSKFTKPVQIIKPQ